MRRAPSASASACSGCRAPPGTITRARRSRRAAASIRAAPRACTLSREAQALLELPAQVDAQRGHQGHTEIARRSACGTAASAPTSRRAARATATSATAATMRCASMPRCCAARSSARAAISASRSSGASSIARRGGRLNTDFIDNSAGVNCSDVEVNLKILLNGAVRAGEITRAARDRLLVADDR